MYTWRNIGTAQLNFLRFYITSYFRAELSRTNITLVCFLLQLLFCKIQRHFFIWHFIRWYCCMFCFHYFVCIFSVISPPSFISSKFFLLSCTMSSDTMVLLHASFSIFHLHFFGNFFSLLFIIITSFSLVLHKKKDSGKMPRSCVFSSAITFEYIFVSDTLWPRLCSFYPGQVIACCCILSSGSSLTYENRYFFLSSVFL